MMILVVVCLLSLVLASDAGGPIVIKEGDSGSVIVGRQGEGSGVHGEDVPIVIDEKKPSLKTMLMNLFMG